MDVSDDAKAVEAGFILNAHGKAWFDSAEIVVIGDAKKGNEPPRPAEGRALENLMALARLLGYVRYFHPSDEAASADWERLAIDAAGVVEPAGSAGELATRLRQVFVPVAPSIQIDETDGLRTAAALRLGDGGKRRVAWRHSSVGNNGGTGLYRSERVTDRNGPGLPSMPNSPEPLDPNGNVFTADLGGGVSCRMAIVLPAGSQGTLPRATSSRLKSAKPNDFPPTADDRATRLADVMLAWNVIQHFYPYHEYVSADWPNALPIALKAAAVDRDAAAFHDTLRRMLALINDSHGYVRGGSGSVANDGALPLSWDWIEQLLVVTDVDSKAQVGDIKPGDVVVSINGRPTEQCVGEAEALVCAATARYRRFRALQDLHNGPAGQTVKLELKRLAEPPHAVTLTRAPADNSPLRGPAMRRVRLPTVKELEPGILYVDLDRFDDAQLPALLPRLDQARGIVFDMRGYPNMGMHIDLLARLSDHPLPSDNFTVPVSRFPDRRDVSGTGQEWSVPPKAPRLKAKVAFMADTRAVSAAETLLSLVANGHLAPIVGEATAGSNGGVNVYVLPGGYRISWTGMKTIRHDGTRFHGVGVVPTASAELSINGLGAGRDEVLEKALAIVRG